MAVFYDLYYAYIPVFSSFFHFHFAICSSSYYNLFFNNIVCTAIFDTQMSTRVFLIVPLSQTLHMVLRADSHRKNLQQKYILDFPQKGDAEQAVLMRTGLFLRSSFTKPHNIHYTIVINHYRYK